MSGDDFLSRWSRRKHAARKGEEPPEPAPQPATALPVAAPGTPPGDGEPAPVAELPPVESLTPESDFSPFMRKDVEPGLRRQALKTLFRDPRFNVMDGLDVYIDDYSKPDPIPPEWLGKLNQMARLGDYQPSETKSEPEGDASRDEVAEAVSIENQGIAEAESAPSPEPAGDESSSLESKHS